MQCPLCGKNAPDMDYPRSVNDYIAETGEVPTCLDCDDTGFIPLDELTQKERNTVFVAMGGNSCDDCANFRPCSRH